MKQKSADFLIVTCVAFAILTTILLTTGSVLWMFHLLPIIWAIVTSVLIISVVFAAAVVAFE